MDPDLPVSTLSVHLMLEVGAARGMSRADGLRGSGIGDDVLLDPLGEIKIRQEHVVLHNFVERFGGEPGIGIDVGRSYHLAMHGTWGLLMSTAKDLREAIAIALEYVELGWAFTSFDFRVEDQLAIVELSDQEIPIPVRSFLIERVVAAMKILLDETTGTDFPLTQVRFRHAAPSDVSRYREVFQVDPEFGADVNSVAFDAALLDVALPQGNEWVQRSYEALCTELLDRRRARTGVSGTVRALLIAEPGHIPEALEVAEQLHVSQRTLFRQLQAEGTSYRNLVDEVRQAIAEELLSRTQLTTEQIAPRLGYAESANFVRAFKRWTGLTPQRFRADATA